MSDFFNVVFIKLLFRKVPKKPPPCNRSYYASKASVFHDNPLYVFYLSTTFKRLNILLFQYLKAFVQ